jgi:hypothetical protein
MDFKKDLSNVAAEVAKIMEAELSAKQKKIAQMSEPKHKIDAGDLAKLRAGHKPVKEETITEDDLPVTTKKSKTVTVKHKTSGKELNVVDTPSVREKYKTMGYHPMKEEAEQVEEGIEDRIEAARKKAKAAGKPMKEPKKEVPMKRRVEGKAYGGAKQKEEMEESTMPFTAMLEAYTEHGLSAFIKEQVEVQQEELTEEVDNETFAKEVDANKKKNSGEMRNDKGVAAAATQSVAVQKEEIEQVEERTLTEPEMKKKEEVVKSMKKNLKGFKERYGERAKSVMYATATKMAKKD